MQELIVDRDAVGRRVDQFICQHVPELSRARVQALLESGDIRVNASVVHGAYKVKANDRIDVTIPPPKPAHAQAQNLPINVLYEDEAIVVVNKQAGLVVHPGAGNPDQTLVNALLHHYPDMTVGDHVRPGIVHRLDKDTSGVMVCARTHAAHEQLVKQFQSRDVTKIYRAFCVGEFQKKSFEIITGHARHAIHRKRFTTKLAPPTRLGPIRLAHTHVDVLQSDGGVSELRVKLLTGRTHQIRAHLSDMGRPLLHDESYGGKDALRRLRPGPIRDAALVLKRQALHAEVLGFNHPVTGEAMEFIAPLPEDLVALHGAISAGRDDL